MENKKLFAKGLPLEISTQPDDTTCGPTCLHAVYRYYGERFSLKRIIKEVPTLEGGGTLAVFLGSHALRNGYRARIYTYNLAMFDPTWFTPSAPDLRQCLIAQMKVKKDPKLRIATEGYLKFIELGGEVRLVDLTSSLIRKYLNKSIPIITGLSSTYLYRAIREYGPRGDEDDIRGEPTGHFVLLYGYDTQTKKVLIADPIKQNPLGGEHYYEAGIARVLCSILLGVITYDAKLLIIEPKQTSDKG